MGISGVTGTPQEAFTKTTESAVKKNTDSAEKMQNTAAVENTAAAVYEKNTEESQDTLRISPKVDTATIDRLKAEAEERTASLRNLVQKLLLKQGGTSQIAQGGLAAMYRSLDVDAATRTQAAKDIADDGYWGVEQTSDRIVSFAKALAGDDKETAEKMMDAVKKGFGLAEKDWGEKLPDISQRTMSSTLDKMNEWISSLGTPSANSAEDGSSAS